MKNNNQFLDDYFITEDIVLASVFKIRGFNIEVMNKVTETHVQFGFKKTNDLIDLFDLYSTEDVLVPARKFNSTLKEIKTQIIENTLNNNKNERKKKGSAFELKIVKKLKRIFPFAKRHLETQKYEADKGVDIENTGRLQIQCKKGKQVPIKVYKYYKQIKQDGIKVVVMARDHQDELVMLSFNDFMKILNYLKTMDSDII